MLNAVFLDLMDQDAWRVEGINRLLHKIPPEERGDLRIVRLLTLRPSLDLGRLSQEFEFRLPTVFRFLVRGLGTRETESPDLLSFLLFQPDYIDRLIRMGETDARARMGEIESVLLPGGSAGVEPERGGARGVEEDEAGSPAGPRPTGPASS
jgi:NTE family protein